MQRRHRGDALGRVEERRRCPTTCALAAARHQRSRPSRASSGSSTTNPYASELAQVVAGKGRGDADDLRERGRGGRAVDPQQSDEAEPQRMGQGAHLASVGDLVRLELGHAVEDIRKNSFANFLSDRPPVRSGHVADRDRPRRHRGQRPRRRRSTTTATTFGCEVEHREVVERDGVEEALLKVADSYIQLLTPSRDDSPVAKYLENKGEGLHHVGYRVDDCAAALERGEGQRPPRHRRGSRGPGSRGTTVAFVHPKTAFGTLIELVQE